MDQFYALRVRRIDIFNRLKQQGITGFKAIRIYHAEFAELEPIAREKLIRNYELGLVSSHNK